MKKRKEADSDRSAAPRARAAEPSGSGAGAAGSAALVGGAPPSEPAASPARASERRWRARMTPLLAFAVAALSLLPFLGASGIWDPYELDVADLARRIAVVRFGAENLAGPGAPTVMPTLSDLKMGELPFTSMALSFRIFGLRDFSGRLPLALWALAGALVLYAFLARLVDRRAGLYGVVALVTMPLYVVHARTMLGDIVTMAANVFAFCGLAGMLWDGAAREAARAEAAGTGDAGNARNVRDTRDEAASPAPRAAISRASLAWLGVALAGLVAGYLSRGLLVGVAVPALAVGLAWAVVRLGTSGRTSPWGGRDALGVLALSVGAIALALGLRVLFRTTPDAPIPRALAFAMLRKPPTEATFDLPIRDLGHALFPWSAFLPFAIGRVLRAPVEAPPEARDRESAVRVALLLGAALAYAAYALLGPKAGALPFAAPGVLAAAIAIAIVDFERGAPPSRALALGCAVLAFVLYRDLIGQPVRSLAAFSVEKPAFPKSFEEEARACLRAALAVFAGLVGIAWIEGRDERPPAGGLRAWARSRASAWLDGARALARVWGGNLLFAAIVVEAALVGLGAMLLVGRRVGWSAVERLGRNFAAFGLNVWWILPLAIGAAPVVWWIVRDGFASIVRAARLPRAAATALAGLVAGGMLSTWYYPALAAQLSPKEVFESFARLAREGEPLALLGVRSRSAAYHYGGEVESFSDATRAYAWLTEAKGQRRFLVTKADDLPRLNSLYRRDARMNLPVVDGRSSQILLVSNEPGPGPSQSWLDRVVLDSPPPPARPLDVLFEDQLEAIGWEIRDRAGRVAASIVPQTEYHLRLYFRVLEPISGNWKVFVHIDGQQRRYNGDHPVIEGKYPMSLWQPGDVVVDDHVFQLEPNFTPGDYTLYFGFFAGDTRFKVTRGAHHENRVNGGTIRVR